MPGGEKVAVLQYGWTFYSDSKFAGNAEVNNKRKSQTGYLARCGEGLVMFYSKTSSTAFACPAIGESHVSTSVGEAETYAVGNAAKSIMSLQYNSEEMGLPFPKRIICQVDSDTAKSFSNNSCKKSKLKHIDCRQEWVQVLSSEVHVVVAPELLCWDLQAMSGEPQQEYRICRLYCVCKKACLNRAANM